MSHYPIRIRSAVLFAVAVGFGFSTISFCAYTAQAADSAQQRCDELAGDPRDPSQAGGGVTFARIQVAEALPACEAAAASAQPHYQFLYGRVLQKAERYQEAFQQYSAAAAGGVPGAMHNLGVLYKYGRGVPKNDSEAQAWYGRADDARRAEEVAGNTTSDSDDVNEGDASAVTPRNSSEASAPKNVPNRDTDASAPGGKTANGENGSSAGGWLLLGIAALVVAGLRRSRGNSRSVSAATTSRSQYSNPPSAARDTRETQLAQERADAQRRRDQERYEWTRRNEERKRQEEIERRRAEQKRADWERQQRERDRRQAEINRMLNRRR